MLGNPRHVLKAQNAFATLQQELCPTPLHGKFWYSATLNTDETHFKDPSMLSDLALSPSADKFASVPCSLMHRACLHLTLIDCAPRPSAHLKRCDTSKRNRDAAEGVATPLLGLTEANDTQTDDTRHVLSRKAVKGKRTGRHEHTDQQLKASPCCEAAAVQSPPAATACCPACPGLARHTPALRTADGHPARRGEVHWRHGAACQTLV